MSDYEIIKSEYNALDEQGNYKTHYLKTSADQVVGLGRMKETEYAVNNVVYTDSNLSVALKCVTAGTTSADELDISNKAIGDTVTDGTVVWQVCNRTSDVTSVNGKTGDVVVDTLPIGAIIPHSSNAVPTGYLTCNGAAVSRIVYADLFEIIGTTYGAGDGSTTFNLPNLNNNSFLEGSDTAGTVKSAGLPNVCGALSMYHFTGASGTNLTITGAFSDSITELRDDAGAGGSNQKIYKTTIDFNAYNYNSIYGASDTVQPKAVTVKYIIKAFAAITNSGNVELENAYKEIINKAYVDASVNEREIVLTKADGTTKSLTMQGITFEAGDTVRLVFWGGGHLTNSKKNIVVSVPTDRPIIANGLTVDALSFSVRDAGSYIIQGGGVSDCSEISTLFYNSGIELKLINSSGWSGTNNIVVGVYVDMTVTFI